MAIGKNKRLTKGGKKGGKKKVADPFTKKDWYDVKVPANFDKRAIGRTLVTRTTGTKIASDALKGRVFEASLGDLIKLDDEDSYRKFKLICEDVQGRHCLTNFHGMDITTDRFRMLVKKWQTLIEAQADIRTSDGYLLRVFCIGFTMRMRGQIRKTSYAQHTQIKAIRKKMVEIMTRDIAGSELKEVVNKLIPNSIGAEIEKVCRSIYPLQNVNVRKVKVLKKPKFDVARLMEMHGESYSSVTVDDKGQVVERADGYEPPVQSSV
jgi:small subunit ribosomal protein S3Ae